MYNTQVYYARLTYCRVQVRCYILPVILPAVVRYCTFISGSIHPMSEPLPLARMAETAVVPEVQQQLGDDDDVKARQLALGLACIAVCA